MNAIEESAERYYAKLDAVFTTIVKKSIFSGFMFGVSNLLMFMTFGLTFFLSVVFVSNFQTDVTHSLSAVFLILFAGMSAGNKANNLQNLMNLSEAVQWIFSRLDLDD